MQQAPKLISLKPTSFVAVIVILVIAIGLAGWVGWSTGFRSGSKKAEQETKAKYEEIAARFMPPIPTEQTSFSGTVEKIEGKTLYVKGPKPPKEILEMGQEMTMKVLVTDATKIYKMTPVPPEEMAAPKEGEEFVPPEPFKRQEMKFEEIKEKMSVLCTAKENLIGKTEFEAVEIQISEMF